MQARSLHQLQEAVEEQTRLVAAADHALRRAELAVSRARTAAAADHAHRQADAALITVEQAELDLARLQRMLTETLPTSKDATRRGAQLKPANQTMLFDVG